MLISKSVNGGPSSFVTGTGGSVGYVNPEIITNYVAGTKFTF